MKAVSEICSAKIEREKKFNSENFFQVIDDIKNSSQHLDFMRTTIKDNRHKLKKRTNEKYMNNFVFSEFPSMSRNKISEKEEEKEDEIK